MAVCSYPSVSTVSIFPKETVHDCLVVSKIISFSVSFGIVGWWLMLFIAVETTHQMSRPWNSPKLWRNPAVSEKSDSDDDSSEIRLPKLPCLMIHKPPLASERISIYSRVVLALVGSCWSVTIDPIKILGWSEIFPRIFWIRLQCPILGDFASNGLPASVGHGSGPVSGLYPRSGQTIITQGDVGREFFIIQSGEAEVLVTDGGSQRLGQSSDRGRIWEVYQQTTHICHISDLFTGSSYVCWWMLVPFAARFLETGSLDPMSHPVTQGTCWHFTYPSSWGARAAQICRTFSLQEPSLDHPSIIALCREVVITSHTRLGHLTLLIFA